MQENLAERIGRLAESETIAMSRMSREMKAQGIDVITLSLGEPDFGTPDFIKDAAIQAIHDDYSKYTPVPGYAELREAISNKFKRDNNLHYSPEQIVVSTGAKQSIANVTLSLVDPGDDVIIPVPYWVTYREIVKMAEGNAIYVESGIESDFKITADQLRSALTPKSRLMIFSSPCNPTGSVYTREELEALAEVILSTPGLYVISDEIYEHINFSGGHASLAEIPGMEDRVITVNGLSKGFAMTGWRLGYIGAPKWIADACTKIQGQFTSGTCSISQRAAITALEADPAVVQEMTNAFKTRRDLVLGLLEEIPGVRTNVPEGAFYVFPDISEYFGKKDGDHIISNAGDLAMYLLQKGHLAMVQGDAFGAPNNLRISYAASETELKEAVYRMKEALGRLS